jgi:sulfane dehydrogenase subunit SoxC
MCRFYFDWEWDGSETLLEARAIDDQGNIQPTINQLREARGEWSIYHNNSIQTWLVKSTGQVENVQTNA